jgi:hypothetical protein
VFYRWQKEFFENGAAAIQAQERPHRQVEEKQKRIEFLEKTTRVVLNRACVGIRNGWMGRGLCGLFKKSGVIHAEVQAKSIGINSFAVADTLLDLRVVVEHAIAEKPRAATTPPLAKCASTACGL